MNQYEELFDAIQPSAILEDIISVVEGKRKASLTPMAFFPEGGRLVSIIEKEMDRNIQLNSIVDLITNIFLPFKFDQQIYRASKLDEIKEKALDTSWYDSLPELFAKTRASKTIRNIGLDYRFHLKPILSSYENPGMLPPPESMNESEKIKYIAKELDEMWIIEKSIILFRQDMRATVEDTLTRIKELEKMKLKAMNGLFMTKESIEYAFEQDKIWGKVLDHPECCVSDHSNRNRTANLASLNGSMTSQRGYLLDSDFLHSGMFDFVASNFFVEGKLDFSRMLKFSRNSLLKQFYTIYVDNFYPCTLECENAYQKGKKFERLLEQIDERYAAIYRLGRLSYPVDNFVKRLEILANCEKQCLASRKKVKETLKKRLGVTSDEFLSIVAIMENYGIQDLPSYVPTQAEEKFQKIPIMPSEYVFDLVGKFYLMGKNVTPLNEMRLTQLESVYDSCFKL